MAMSSRLLAAAASCAMLGACTTAPLPQAGSLDAGWGEASKYNAAVQIIDPEPVYTAQGAQPGDNGEKAANATKRYRTDQVKDTQPTSSTQRSGMGGSGGSSGPR
jgi:hypothetical protein